MRAIADEVTCTDLPKAFIHIYSKCSALQALGMPSRVMLESPPQHITPSPRRSIPALDQSSTTRSHRMPRTLLAKAGSQPAWERELQESKQAQLQRSQSSVALVQRSFDFEDDIFDSQEMSNAAAVWEDIIEVSHCSSLCSTNTCSSRPVASFALIQPSRLLLKI